MGFRETDGIKAKLGEAERQISNIRRDFRPWKNPGDLGNTVIPKTPSDIKQDLVRLKQDAPKKLPHLHSLSKAEKTDLGKLTSSQIKKYKILDTKRIKSIISQLHTKISIAQKKRDF